MYGVKRLGIIVIISVCSLVACGPLPTGGSTAQQDAAQRFLTERNGGTPVVIGGPNDAQASLVAGTVERVAGRTMTIKRLEGTPATVQLADGAAVWKAEEIRMADIKVGERVTAIGEKDGAVFRAEMVQIGADDKAAGGPVIRAGKGDAGPARNIAFGPPLAGTVQRVDGETITVQGTDGSSTTVELSDSGKVLKRIAAEASAIQSGAFISATGEQKGEVFEATRVEILPPPAR